MSQRVIVIRPYRGLWQLYDGGTTDFTSREAAIASARDRLAGISGTIQIQDTTGNVIEAISLSDD